MTTSSPAFDAGVRSFYGVLVDDYGFLVLDEQEPDSSFFAEINDGIRAAILH